MTTKSGWMIYGANGYAGRLVAREAIALGERPLLAGRPAEKVRRVAEEVGLPWVAFVESLPDVRVTISHRHASGANARQGGTTP
jgi:short subunit dehydrogenase-like uncharacterized protein